MVTKEMSIEELRELVAPAEGMSRTTFDPRTGGSRFQMDPENKLRFLPEGGGELLMMADSYLRLAQLLGIPGAYIKKTPHWLMVPHMNYWLANSNQSQLTFAVEEGVIRLFSRGALEPVSNELILEAIEDVYGKKLLAHHVSHNIFDTVFSIVSEEMSEDVKVGDPVRVGVTIENSYAMTRPLSVSVYVHRLVCANGAISADNVYRFIRRGRTDAIEEQRDWISDTIHSAREVADLEVARLRRMGDLQFDGHLSDSLSSVFTELGVPLRVRETITDGVIDRGVDNLYDLYNVITDVASNDPDVLEDPALSHRLMRVGGRLSTNPDLCPNCHRIMG